MQLHNKTPENLLVEDTGKDTSFNGVNQLHSGFSIEDIKTEVEAKFTKNEAPPFNNNPFPIEALPLSIQQIITTTNQTLNFPIDYIGASLLYATSVAIGNTHIAQIKNGFQQSAVLYLALVGRAGTNKSAPLEFALKPIFNKDKKAFDTYTNQNEAYTHTLKQYTNNKDKTINREPIKPYLEKVLLSDYTPEALTNVHKNNKRGIGIYVDELAGWIKNFNRYNNGSEIEFWLSNWSGKPINIDRKKDEPVYIPHSFISVAGTIQNSLLKELAKDNRNQNGFIDRILFVMPDNLQKQHWNEKELPIQINDLWQQKVSDLLNLPCSFDGTTIKPKVLEFSIDAKKLLFSWQQQNTDLCNNAESEAIGSMYSKMDMYIVRFALILEILKGACNDITPDLIGTESVDGAIKLTEYFKNTALKVHGIINNFKPIDTEPEIKQTVYDALPPEFATSEGVKIAKDLGMPERTFKNFIKDKKLFLNTKHGEHKKLQ